ncbi:hypothetical protein BDW74DRAFT_152880 [Aspergillus multicolor]|uniref:uncharacterized protein n=1 Tax=Aspergillus multicolor TaxID=41759 RepID=UPI003CCDCFC9
MAARFGHSASLMVLLKAQEELDYKRDGLTSSLHEAAETGTFHAVELLLHAGADLNATDDFGTTSLQSALI